MNSVAKPANDSHVTQLSTHHHGCQIYPGQFNKDASVLRWIPLHVETD